VVEAVMRFRTPEPVAGGMMFVVAVIGLVVNGISAWLLHGVREGGLNVRAAYLHVMGDLLASAGTVVAALIIRATGWYHADPIVSLLTTILIVSGAWRLVRESVDVLLEAAPAHIDIDHVRDRLQGIIGVESVHDLHVWTLTSGMVAMSAHAVVRQLEDNQKVLASAYAELRALGIQHSTIQLEESQLVECGEHAHP
jgi:cobalt-zinc-cadmium efflux system protein